MKASLQQQPIRLRESISLLRNLKMFLPGIGCIQWIFNVHIKEKKQIMLSLARTCYIYTSKALQTEIIGLQNNKSLYLKVPIRHQNGATALYFY